MGGDIAENTVSVNVATNNLKGYNLQIHTTADGGKMTNGATGEIAGGVPTEGESKWGYKADVSDADVAKDYQAVPTSATTVRTSAAAADEDTVFTFGASASTTQEAGEYEATVVFTATAKN